MTNKPHMTLPSGDVLYEGDYGVTRNGYKVGPAAHDRSYQTEYPWNMPRSGHQHWHKTNGKSCTKCRTADIIAKWVDQDTPKLWRDMTDAEKGALLLAHHEKPGSVEFWNVSHWEVLKGLGWVDEYAYRIKPKKPRELWVDLSNGQISPIKRENYIHVREVMEDDT